MGEDVLTMKLSIYGQSLILSDIQMNEVVRKYNRIFNP